MADRIRCPMCGKENPAGLEVCQFCQARLKPLVAPPAAGPEEPAAPGGELPDWLRSLRQTDAGEDEAASENEAVPAEDAETPDWLSSLRANSPAQEEPAEGSGEAPLWSPGAAAFEAADWRTGMDFGETADEELPQEPDLGQPSDALPADDEPEWLLRIRSRQEEENAGQAPPAGEGDLPPGLGWGEAAFAAPEGAGASSDDLPDWLAGFSSAPVPDQPDASAVEAEPAAQPNSSADLPDWLAAFSQPAAPQSEDEPLPEWLAQAGRMDAVGDDAGGSDLPPTDEGGAEAFTAGSLAEEGIGPGWESSQEAAEEPLPDWLSREEENGPSTAPSEETPAPQKTSWLDEIGAVAFDTGAEKQELPPAFSGVAPFALNEDNQAQFDLLNNEEALPDWLVQATTDEGPGEAPARPPAEENGEELAHAELPTWLEAMRPVEAQSLSADSEATVGVPERAGPLAGLRGVLPAEADISQARKPPAYSVKLHVTEGHQAHADLLSRMIQAEGEARLLPSRPAVSSQYLLRLLIFLALLAVVGLAVFAPGLVGNFPASPPALPPEIVAASRLVTGLPAGAPVLMAFDYQPAYSGEMDAASGAILDHLMVKGVFLTLVSTTPTGPVQAERLVGSVVRRTGHTYLPSQQYANLGFIPGGSAGLLSFAQSPAQTMPFTLDGLPAWETGGLQSVSALSDFAMVLVMTENPDTARSWIEQVQPSLGDTPLLMVVSAQAEPLVRPYYAGVPQQVQGMVTGLAGGAAYETLTGRQGPASAYWTPFRFGLLAAVVLILIGSGANAVMGLNARRKEAAEGGRQP